MYKFVLTGLLLAAATTAGAQQKTLAATMNVYVFPTQGQDATQQSTEEAECYQWAVGNTGSDPFALAKQQQADQEKAAQEQKSAQQAGRGSGARGAVRGAAAGALIGEIANDDASEGAAWGAAAGTIRGRRKAREAQQRAQASASSQAAQREKLTSEQLNNFKKAFSVCLEAKNYLVKY